MTRRDLLKWGSAHLATAVAGGAAGCDFGRPRPRLLSSRTLLPTPFQTHLPRLPVLQPTSQTADSIRFSLTAKALRIRLLPNHLTEIWGYNGLFPGPIIEAQTGRSITVDLQNELPVPTVMHLHGGRTPPESDGYPTDLVLPKAGWAFPPNYDPNAKVALGRRSYTFPNQQRAATLWYHDHRMDFTGPQVWRGLAGFYIIRDQEERKLPLPSGDKEYALMICDRSFDEDGSFLYPAIEASLSTVPGVTHPFMGGVLGDVMLVNGVPWPQLEVSDTKYRLRIVNASNARHLTLALTSANGQYRRITQIGSDGGLLERPVLHATLPVAPSERFDVIVDFSGCKQGERLVLRNLDGEGQASSVMCFDVTRSEVDHSEIPERLCDFERLDMRSNITVRNFDFSYGGMEKGWLINGKGFDPSRSDATCTLDDVELWHLHSDRTHPLHLHLAHFQVVEHLGRPRPTDAGWKDTISMHAGQVASILVKFSGYRGRYVFHCHNLEHEDMAMMGNFTVI